MANGGREMIPLESDWYKNLPKRKGTKDSLKDDVATVE